MRGPPLAFMALDSFASTKGCSESEEAQQLIRWLVLTSDKKGFVSRHSPIRPHRSTHIDRLPPSAPEQSSYHFDHHHNSYNNHNSHNQSNHNNHNQSKHHHHSNRQMTRLMIQQELLAHHAVIGRLENQKLEIEQELATQTIKFYEVQNRLNEADRQTEELGKPLWDMFHSFEAARKNT